LLAEQPLLIKVIRLNTNFSTST